MNSIVVHYKELALKGKNRSWFVSILQKNLRTALAGLGVSSVRQASGRIELEFDKDEAWSELQARLGGVFGIANFSRAGKASLDFDELATAILKDLGPRSPK